MLKIGTVFSGIGAFECALDRLNINYDIKFACDNGERKLKVSEVEVFKDIENMDVFQANSYVTKLYDCQNKENFVELSYKANFNLDEKLFFQDARFLDGKFFRNQLDILVGGSPCQSFSIAGKRKGLEESRGTLFYEYARLVKETQPKVFIYENVTGMLNHDGGKTWEVISRIFDSLNYHWTYWVLNAKDYGIPQNRKRVFAIGFRNDYGEYFKKLEKPKPVRLEREMLHFLESHVDNKYYLPEKGFVRVTNVKKNKKYIALNGKIARCQVATQQYNWYGDMRFETELSESILRDSRIHKGVYESEYGAARCLTPRECLRLMGFPDEFKIVVPDQQMYRQSGNSIVVDVLVEIFRQINEVGIFKKNE